MSDVFSSLRFILKATGILFYRAKAPLHRVMHFLRYEWRRSSPFRFSYFGYCVLYEKGDGLAHHLSGGYPFEPDVIGCAVSLLRPGDVMIDAGANIGLISLAVQRKVPHVVCHCFEPSPYPYRMFKKTIRENHLQKYLIPRNIGLYNKTGELKFHVHAANDALGDGIQDTHRAGRTQPITVRVITVDRFMREYAIPNLRLMKIDVEGAELYVLKGAKHTIMKFRPAILFEANPKNIQAYNLHVFDVHRLLSSIKYEIYDLKKNRLSEDEFALRTQKEDNFLALPA